MAKAIKRVGVIFLAVAIICLMAISLFNIFYQSIGLVIYYRRNERKYYIDAETVIDSKHSIKSVY